MIVKKLKPTRMTFSSVLAICWFALLTDPPWISQVSAPCSLPCSLPCDESYEYISH